LLSGIPTDEDVARWRADLKRLRGAIADLHDKEAKLERLIAAWSGEAVERAGTTVFRRKKGSGDATWIGQVKAIALKNPEGISYDDVREALPEPFASMIEEDPSHKSFYGAMRRLDRSGDVVRHNNHLFTPDGFKKYKADLEAGKREPVDGYDRRSSPMQEALKAFLEAHPWSKPVVIKDALCENPELKPGLTRNSATIYNVLNKLKDRGELLKNEEDGSYALADENEAPNGKTGGASETGEAATSSDDASPLFRVVK